MKSIKLLIFLIISVTFLNIFGYSQSKSAKPNFSGLWILDEKASRIADGFWNSKLEIIHNEPEISISFTGMHHTEEKTAEAIFYSDKRGEATYPYFYYPDEKVSSITRWTGNSLVRIFSKTGAADYAKVVNSKSKVAGKFITNTREEYTLSKDGKQLIVRIDRTTQMFINPGTPIEGNISQKFVFIKE